MNDKELKHQQKLELREQERVKRAKFKTIMKAEHIELKAYIKQQKIKLKELSVKNKLDVREFHKEKINNPEELNKVKMDYLDATYIIKNDIYEQKFAFGEKFKTLKWQCLKWSNGIHKEFNRIIWSNPTNTFKYLGIIVLVILVLAGLFFGIDNIIKTFK